MNACSTSWFIQSPEPRGHHTLVDLYTRGLRLPREAKWDVDGTPVVTVAWDTVDAARPRKELNCALHTRRPLLAFWGDTQQARYRKKRG